MTTCHLPMNRSYFFKLMVLVACSAPVCASIGMAEERPLRVGSKAFTESVILGELLYYMARSTGANVEHKSEMGSRVAFEALKAGELDLYPDYTGTLTSEILANEKIRTEVELTEALEKLGIRMSARLGFNNTYALGLRRKFAEELNLKKISDLRSDDPRIARLRFGFSDEFMQRRDGWPGLAEKYRLPQTAIGMNHNLAYQGLERGAIDVTDLFSTDAEIRSYDLTVLEDDQGYFPVYHCVILYRLDLEQRAPQLVKQIEGLAGKIDNATMVELNAKARVDRVSETRVAIDFLIEHFHMQIAPPGDSYSVKLIRDLWITTQQHLLLVTASLLAAIVVAIPLGILAAKFKWLEQFILGSVGIIQTIPSLAVLVLMIPLLGLGFKPAICALFLYSLLPIVRGTYSGLTEIPPNLLESATVLGLPPATRLRLVELPLASRAILSGVKTAAVINVGTATIGGLIGAGGYGQPIMTGIRLADISLLLQGALPAACLAIFVQIAFDISERWFVPAGLRLPQKNN
jgi:osmoprotectant transport system permease protein